MNNSMNNLQIFTLIGLSTILLISIIITVIADDPAIGFVGMFFTVFFGFFLIGATASFRETKEEVTLELGHSQSKVFGVRDGVTVWESNDYLTVVKTKDMTTAKFVATTSYNLYNCSTTNNPTQYKLSN